MTDVMLDTDSGLEAMSQMLRARRWVALTGAGCSTESGIPDYRGAGTPAPRNPIQHDAFVRRPEVRRRYWARATLGWSRFAAARPNPAHRALAGLEAAGMVAGIITQNVDRLHHAAGSRRVVELHGALADVRCLACGAVEARASVHERLVDGNAAWLTARSAEARLAPDGDSELAADAVESFRVVSCLACSDGALKPDVVFFGGTVPEATVSAAHQLVDQAEALVVIGSSLAVYSGFRFVRRARERGLPVGLVNLGPTRADELAQARLAARAGRALPELARLLGVAA
jgi:NAD-dependent SIR2 family protein deacetylase